MIETSFEIYVASLETICTACENRQYEKLQAGEITENYLLFSKDFGAAEILYLSEAITFFTNESYSFEPDDQREPESSVFVDRLNRKLVAGAAQLTDDDAAKIQQLWIELYYNVERTAPEWSKTDQIDLIKRFLHLCRIAVNSDQDLIHLWFL